MIGRLLARVKSWFAAPPCERCGSPSAGVYAATTRSHGVDAAGNPVTRFRARRVERLCGPCLGRAMGDPDDFDRGGA